MGSMAMEKKMIDIHTHILPYVDDGAANWDEALEMAQQAVYTGINTVIATMHFAPGYGNSTPVTVYKECFEEFQNKLRIHRIPLNVVSGMEILSDGNTAEYLRDRKALPLNDTNYVLVEFLFDTSARQMERDLMEILQHGYLPVLAHPERYDCIVPDDLYEWKKMGVVIQLNKGSVLGRFGKKVRRNAQQILSLGLASVIASDAHSAEYRTFFMDELCRVLETDYGRMCVDLLLYRNPAKILNGIYPPKTDSL